MARPSIFPLRIRHLVFLALASTLAGSQAFATPFVPETVASGYGDIGRFNSLVLDGKGLPHISYYDGQFGHLMYASRSADGTWSSEIADAGGFDYVGLYTSLKLNPAGEPRISYYDSTAADLRFASKSGSTWTVETVDAAGDRGQFSSLALDASGNPHISYYNSTSGYLMYASKVSGTWTIENADPDPTNYVGQCTSLALDRDGRPHISYLDVTGGNLKYATKSVAGTWSREFIETVTYGNLGTSIALDPKGDPAIVYHGPNTPFFDLKYAARTLGSWSTEFIWSGVGGGNASLAFDTQGNPCVGDLDQGLRYSVKIGGVWTNERVELVVAAQYPSIALDNQGNPKISYFAGGADGLKLMDSAIRVTGPAPGTTWPVGALRTIDWRGFGPVNISLSVDGGASYQTLLEGIGQSPVAIRVPHAPTHFARVKVERQTPLSTALSESLFTIQTSVSLLSLLAAPAPGKAGAVVSWQTDPGPEDLAGYRLEKAALTGDWRTVVARTSATSYEDPVAGPATRYRLFAINGLGEEFLLGETSLRPAVPLAAWPLPYRGGNLSIAFATTGGLGGGPGSAEVAVYDISGRLVRQLTRGRYAAGYESATWDGRDEGGQSVGAGLYFLRALSGGEKHIVKFVVMH